MSQAVRLDLTVGYVSQLERGAKRPTASSSGAAQCDSSQRDRGHSVVGAPVRIIVSNEPRRSGIVLAIKQAPRTDPIYRVEEEDGDTIYR